MNSFKKRKKCKRRECLIGELFVFLVGLSPAGALARAKFTGIHNSPRDSRTCAYGRRTLDTIDLETLKNIN